MSELDILVPQSIPHRHVACGFTTRSGGISPPPFDALNVGSSTRDDGRNTAENRRIVYRFAGVDERNVALMGQVHGAVVKVVDSGGLYEKTDGLVTVEAGLMLGVVVADCIPLLLYDPDFPAVAAIHCGWRSITGGIAEKAFEIMGSSFSTRPDAVTAVLGPSAGPCCYEIGGDVARLLHDGSVRYDGSRLYADLKTELGSRLVRAGVPEKNIERYKDCTICNEYRYFSHRRDGRDTGRMIGFIMLKGPSS